MKEIVVRIKATFDLTPEDVEEALYENYLSVKRGEIEVTDLMNEPASPEREPDEY